jgi:hypothetical protein
MQYPFRDPVCGMAVRDDLKLSVPLLLRVLYALLRGGNESPASWDPASFARKRNTTVEVTIEGRPVRIGAWQYDVAGITDYSVPLIFLDTRVEGNAG